MRATIIGGLMAVGLLAGCGGAESGLSEVSGEERTAQSTDTCEPCCSQYLTCMRAAKGGPPEDVTACIENREACEQQYCL